MEADEPSAKRIRVASNAEIFETTISDLPDEILQLVFGFSEEWKWKFSLMHVCRRFRLLVQQCVTEIDFSLHKRKPHHQCNIAAVFPKIVSVTLVAPARAAGFTVTGLKSVLMIGCNLRRLVVKSYGGDSITDACVGDLHVLCRHLEVLYLEGLTKITNKAILHLQRCDKLRKLSLARCRKINDSGLHYFTGLTQLQKLILDDTGVAGRELPVVAKQKAFGNLRTFSLLINKQRAALTYGIAALPEYCPHLRKLCGAEVNLIWAVASYCKELRELKLHAATIDKELALLTDGCPKLERLELFQPNVSDEGLLVLAKLPLTRLVMHYPYGGVTSAGLRALRDAISTLKDLVVTSRTFETIAQRLTVFGQPSNRSCE